MGARALDPYGRPHGALAACLDQAVRGLEQDGDVGGQPPGVALAHDAQPISLRLDLLAVVEQVRHVDDRRGDCRGEVKGNRAA